MISTPIYCLKQLKNSNKEDLTGSLFYYYSMTELKRYIETPRIDGHVHLFNYDDLIEYPYDYDIIVGFMDIEFDKDGNASSAYDNFIKNHYDENKHVILATAKNIDDIESIFNQHKGVIRGFGELKLYDNYMGKELPYKKISYLRSVCKLSEENGCLPIYVHWELTDDKSVRYFENALKSYPNIPIVLCHCGMNGSNEDFAYGQCQRLQHLYSNLILDISYSALDYFYNEPLKLYNLILDRIILGSDLNNKIFGPNHSEKEIIIIGDKLKKLRTYVNPDKTIASIFGMTN